MTNEAKRQLRDVLQLLVIVLPLMVGMFVWWFHSPLYKAFLEEQRGNARLNLIESYYNPDPLFAEEREKMIQHYSFTEDEVNPANFLKRWQDEKDN